MAAFVSDTCTDTAGTTFASHTGETGATWTLITDAGGNGEVLISDANRIRCNSVGVNGSNAAYYPSGSPAGADYSVESDFRCVTNNGIMGLLIRADGATINVLNGYYLQYRTFYGWRLFVLSASGVGTQIGSTYSTEMSDASTVHAKLEVAGSDFIVTLDGVSRITGSDGTYSAAGKPAVIFNSTALNSTGIHLDNISATDAAGGGGGGRIFKLAGQGGGLAGPARGLVAAPTARQVMAYGKRAA